MAYFFGVRGWLEMNHPEEFNQVTQKIESIKQRYSANSTEALYMSGWTWIEKPFNWTAYIHYGGDVKAEGLELFEQVIREIASFNFELYGFFHVQGEDLSQNFTYKIEKNKLLVEEVQPLLDTSWSSVEV